MVEQMPLTRGSKYQYEYILDFQSNDRFLYRVSDLEATGEFGEELRQRLDKCQIYVLARRPRLTIVPGSIESTSAVVRLKVQYHLAGLLHQVGLDIPRHLFKSEEVTFEASEYPHRSLISRNDQGKAIVESVLGTFVEFMPGVHQQAKDLEVLYIGKGVHKNAQDRLRSHSTLQRILAELMTNQPDNELSVLVYAFEYHKRGLRFAAGFSHEITGDVAKRRSKKAMAYRPSLGEQISLIEASCISYFQPPYNTHYLNFPSREYKLLAPVYKADFAAVAVQLDNTNIGGQQLYSSIIKPDSTHYIVVDFRRLEGKPSIFDGVRQIQRFVGSKILT